MASGFGTTRLVNVKRGGRSMRSLLALAVALTGAGSCSSSGRCEGPLGLVGAGCPRTFDGAPEHIPACPPGVEVVNLRQCGGLNALLFATPGGYSCYYDGASGQLVGAEGGSDTRDFCGGTSFEMVAGRLPPDSCGQEPFTQFTCQSPSSP